MDFFKFIKDNKLILLFISIIGNILLISGCIYFIYRLYNTNHTECGNSDLSNISDKRDACENIEPVKNSFYVEVKGAVKKPGVYLVNDDNIINDLINLAGGFKKNAYSKNINLSKQLTKELVIYVYTENEYKKNNTKEEVKEVVCVCPTYDISECTNNTISEIVVNNDENTNKSITINNDEIENNDNISSNSYLVNINTASKEELMKLTGIGESKALDIISYRKLNGNFKSIEDIKNVSGIGNSIYEKIKDSITV